MWVECSTFPLVLYSFARQQYGRNTRSASAPDNFPDYCTVAEMGPLILAYPNNAGYTTKPTHLQNLVIQHMNDNNGSMDLA